MFFAASPAISSMIYGRVVDSETGLPVENASVSIIGSHHGVATDKDGSYRIDDLGDGLYLLRIEHIAHDTVEPGPVRLTSDLDVRRDIFLPKATLPVSGIVIDGRPSTASPMGGAASEAGSIVTRLNIDALRRAGIGSVGAALATVAGVHVRSSGGAHPAAISLRGAGAARTRVIVDGATINDPATGIADLRSIAFDEIERIEVWRGATGGAVGGMAGAIQIVTVNSALSTGDPPNGMFEVPAETSQRIIAPRIGLGSHGSSEARFRFAQDSAPFAGNITFWSNRGNGDFAVSDPEYPFTRRVNGDVSSHSIQAGLSHRSSRLTWRGSTAWSETEGGLPGTSEYVTPDARSHSSLGRVVLGASAGGPFDARLSGTVSAIRSEREYVSPPWQAGLPTFPVHLSTRSETLEAQFRVDHGHDGLSVLVSGAHDRFQDADHLAADRGVGSVRRNRVAVDATRAWHLRIGDATCRVQPGLRIDDPGDRSWLMQPRFSGALSGALAQESSWRLTLGSGRSARAPNFNELFWSGDRYSGGNPDLRSELAFTWDGSVSIDHPGGLGLEISVHRSKVEDWIEWQPGATNVWTPHNVGRVRSEGVEAQVRGRKGSAFVWDGTFTVQSIQNADPDAPDVFGKALILRPSVMGSIHAGWTPNEDCRLDFSLRHIGKRPTTRTNTVWLAPYTLIDLQARQTLLDQGKGNLVGGIGITNLTNQDYRAVPDVYPPPREYRIFLEWIWTTKAG